jgi:hypothetical protein
MKLGIVSKEKKMNLFNKKTILVSILLAFGASGHVLANPINTSASGTSSTKVATITDNIHGSSQANQLDQASKQTQLRQQIKQKKNKKFHRTIYPMFP